MHDQSSSLESEAHAYLDQAVLQIMLDNERQRPISETEVARIVSTPGHVPASLKRLRVGGLIHRWNDLATAIARRRLLPRNHAAHRPRFSARARLG